MLAVNEEKTADIQRRRKEGDIMKKTVLVLPLVLVVGLILFPMKGDAQMERGMTGHGMMPVMGMAGFERMGVQRMGLMGVFHRWGSYLFTQKDQLGLTETRLDKIESVLNSHIKYAIRKDADRKILLIEIQELLVKDKVNFSEVDGKLKAMEALNTDMKMEGIRTLEQALAILTPEQQKKAKTLFKEATLIRARRMAPMQGKMMGRGGMICTDTMKRMMGKKKGPIRAAK
jgi:Spy/CpxP family protein refolding chaperone